MKRLSLSYEITAQDGNGVALASSNLGRIDEELSPQDKNWLPKRSATFSIPSFVAAGEFYIRVTVKDLIAKTDTSKDFAFQIGGTTIEPGTGIRVQNLHFYRSENDRDPLDVPAFRAGDTVFMRFELVGFKLGQKNSYDVAYAVKVLRPDGKIYFEDPQAAKLTTDSFYPAQFVPGNLAISTSADTSGGQYTVVLTVRDLLAKTSVEGRQTFQIE